MKNLKTINEERMDFVAQEAVKASKEDIKKLYDHARVANEEMSVIKIDVAAMKTDVSWLKDTSKTHGTLLWSILGTLILGFLTAIALKLYL